jgi:uncharacterized membrane protein
MGPLAGILGLLLLTAIMLLWVLQAFILGAIADRSIARPIVSWVILFLFAPVISHLTFVVLYTMVNWKRKSDRVKAQITNPTAPRYQFLGHQVIDYSRPPEVTPFEGTGTVEPSRVESDFILLQYRDKKVEELIEWKQWGVALKLVEEKIRDAQSIGDKKIEQVYQAYLDLIKPRIGRPLD